MHPKKSVCVIVMQYMLTTTNNYNQTAMSMNTSKHIVYNLSVLGYLVRGDRLVVALECVDSLRVAQCPPLVPLVCVGFGQHF